jgi:hypothetical protein
MNELIEAIMRTWQAIGFEVEADVESNMHAIEVCIDGGCFDVYGQPTEAARATLSKLIDDHGWVGALRKIDHAMSWKLV